MFLIDNLKKRPLLWLMFGVICTVLAVHAYKTWEWNLICVGSLALTSVANFGMILLEEILYEKDDVVS